MSLTYITRKEYRVGLDASLFNGLVSVNTNFFHQTTSGLLTQGASTVYPSFYNSGLGDFLPTSITIRTVSGRGLCGDYQ